MNTVDLRSDTVTQPTAAMRAAMMAAIKLAGELIQAQKMIAQSSPNPQVNPEHLIQIEQEVLALEQQVDSLMKTLSLPGAPRPIVP